MEQIEHAGLAHSPENQPMIFEEIFEGWPMDEGDMPNYGTPNFVYDEAFEEKLFNGDPDLLSLKEIVSPTKKMKRREIYSVNMIVLVHGFQGSASDMKSMRGFLGSHYPELHIMISKANEGSTHTDLDSQGFRLAAEVKKNINEMVGESNLRSISFMGHSLGGVIIRAALPYLKEYHEQFQTLITLGSPHLGAISSGNTLVDCGMWYLRNIIKYESILQIMTRDHWSINQKFMYTLSLDSSIGKFKNIIMTGSPQGRFPNLASLAFGFLPSRLLCQLPFCQN